MKKVVIITPYFDPENFPINNFAYEIRKKKINVDVITCLPNYRKKGLYKDYSYIGPYFEIINNVKIYRVPIIPRFSNSFLSILIFYLSYFIFTSFFIFFYALLNIGKIKHVISFCGSPVYVGFFSSILALITRATSSQWVQDIWPEAIETTQGLNNKMIIKIISSLQSFMWNTSDIIFAQSNMLNVYLNKHLKNKKIFTLYNPVREDFNQLTIKKKLNDKTIYSYMGNIGGAQSIEDLLKAYLNSNNEFTELHICGDGADLEYLKKNYDEKKIFWHGWINENEMTNIIEKTDFFLLSLNNKGRQNYIIPSKLQTYLKNSRPVICLSTGAANDLISSIKGGFVVKKDTQEEMISTFNLAQEANLECRNFMGNNNREYYENHFRQSVIVENFIKIIN
ncbi:glycosyltransferase family 4 protein [Pelagibacterales bacterium]|nr:glycosyltransferase family 4 protein [Pelagibacterales bacterium]